MCVALVAGRSGSSLYIYRVCLLITYLLIYVLLTYSLRSPDAFRRRLRRRIGERENGYGAITGRGGSLEAAAQSER